ncbi:MAG: 3-hydroxyacyl-CoA dehydrogenase NAD-binding domain-containing protein [Magnetospiraceae bacterium]
MVVSTRQHGAIMLVTVDNPPVNALSQQVRAGLLDAVTQVNDTPGIKAAVLICAGRTFIAGADVKEFDAPPLPPQLPDVIAAIEASDIPWIAAIHGTALGGGFEVTLGCHYRLCDEKARLGLPEVTLGIIPGSGGTERLPRLVPLENAVAMITGGRPIDAHAALKMGAIDRIGDGPLLEAALDYAEEVAAEPVPVPLAERPAHHPTTPDFWTGWETKLRRSSRGQASPLIALETLRDAVEIPFRDAAPRARKTFLDLRQSDQAKALRHAFFAERKVARPPSLQDIPPRPLADVAVIGGGTMGAGIAAAFLSAGYAVTLLERDADSLAHGQANLEKILASSVKKGRLDGAGKAAQLNRLTPSTDYSNLADVDLAVEAVFEDLAVKQDVFRQLDAVLKPGAILATNTSYLDVNAIAAVTQRPADVVGLHFFSPAHIMKLLEVVEAESTAPDVMATAFALAGKLRKVAVRSGVCDGFIGNRILQIYRRQADFLLADGCLPQDVDAAMRAFGLPMGPYEAQDLGGLDIAWANRKRNAHRRDPAARYVAIADALCEEGRFGQKTGAGWYRYAAGNRTPLGDPAVTAIIEAESQKQGITRRAFETAEIQQRILWPMINEGAHILAEGIAQRPLEIDMVELHGYGFPRWRGGLMFYADTMGLDRIVADLTRWAERDPLSFTPAPLLADLVARGAGFASLND